MKLRIDIEVIANAYVLKFWGEHGSDDTPKVAILKSRDHATEIVGKEITARLRAMVKKSKPGIQHWESKDHGTTWENIGAPWPTPSTTSKIKTIIGKAKTLHPDPERAYCTALKLIEELLP